VFAGAAGKSTATGAVAACACTSVVALTVEPASTTPPFATPACTGRVSVTELTTVPVGRVSAALSAVVLAVLLAEMIVLKRPGSVPGIVTTTRPSRCSTVEPGMKRIVSPLRAPAVRPAASTTTALVD